MSGVEAVGVSKTFGAFRALDRVNVSVPSGALAALLGPSGSGKTTLLRMIAGLERPDPDGGRIRLNGEDVTDVPVNRRGVGFVFQNYALFGHLTVAGNIAFGLEVRGRRERPSRAAIRERVRELLRLVRLEGLDSRYPRQLSGGQRQRVALARALAIDPGVLLLDEPFGALDAKVRKELRTWIRRLHDEIGVTSVLVTHDQEDALEVADHVIVVNNGHVEQAGPPGEVYHNPANDFVMGFLGETNELLGWAKGGRLRLTGLPAGDYRGSDAPDGLVRVLVRPHELELCDGPHGDDSLAATVVDVHLAGPVARVRLRASTGDPLLAEIGHAQVNGIACGDQVFVHPRAYRLFGGDAAAAVDQVPSSQG